MSGLYIYQIIKTNFGPEIHVTYQEMVTQQHREGNDIYIYSIKAREQVLVRIHSMWCNTSKRGGSLYV